MRTKPAPIGEYTAQLDEALAPLIEHIGADDAQKLRQFAANMCHQIKFETRENNKPGIRYTGMLKALFIMRELAPIIDNMSEE